MRAQCAGMNRDIPAEDRLILALDVPTVDEAKTLVSQLGGSVRFFKIGLQLLSVGGMDFAAELKSQGYKIFLDWKLHDIPATVEKATRNIVNLGADMLTVHATPQVMQAAATGKGNATTKILGVTVLTSLGTDDLAAIGLNHSADELVKRRAQQAIDAGIDGVVSSPVETPMLREQFGQKLCLVTPGIRPTGADKGDQKRATTPADAIKNGADYLVIGRPISQAPDPKTAAIAIQDEIKGALGI